MSAATRSPQPARYLPLLVLVFVGLSAALIAGYFLLFKKQYALLYQDLRPEEASAVVEVLKKQQVDYRLDDGGQKILVPAPQIDTVRLSLAGADMPLRG